MDGYTTEEEQVELLKKWWDENGKSAIFGIVLGLAAIFGWREWQSHTISQIESASEIYQQALTATNQDQFPQAREKANELLSNYGDTGYAVFARLILAHVAAEEADYTTAETQLTAAIDNISNVSLAHEVTLRLARIHLATGKVDQALTLLNRGDYGAFAPVYNELKGDAYAAQGKTDEARQAYQQAIAESQGSDGDLSLLNLKLDTLGN